MVSNKPLAHVLIVCASNPKSKFLKKEFTPSANDSPKFLQSNVVPNESRKCNAEFKEFAIVFPTLLNNLGDIRPLRKFARPFPKLSAFL